MENTKTLEQQADEIIAKVEALGAMCTKFLSEAEVKSRYFDMHEAAKTFAQMADITNTIDSDTNAEDITTLCMYAVELEKETAEYEATRTLSPSELGL